MREHEGTWTEALTENGAYDPEKAKRASETAVSQYQRGLKKTERILWIYLLACVVIAVLCFDGFMFAASEKAMIGCGVLFLVAIETTILMKLWYWIVNTKLTLQKELRQWQLREFSPEPMEHAPTWMGELSFGRQGLPPWERRAWLVGLMLTAIAASSYATHWLATASNLLTLTESVKVSPDGASSSTMHVSYQPRSGLSADSFPLQTGCLEGRIRWLDERGRPLPFDVSTVDGQRHYTVHLIEPIGMGDWLQYTQMREIPSAAVRKGDLWTYRNDLTYGCSTNRFFITVELPRGAEVASVEPKPIEQFAEAGVPTLVFSAIRDRNEPFRYAIQYRLPEKPAAEKPVP